MFESSSVRRLLWFASLFGLAAMVSWWSMSESNAALMANSAVLAACSVAISVPIGTLLAVVMARIDVWGKRVFDICLLVLLFLPLYVQLAGWEAGFGRGGWYSTLIAEKLSEPPLEGLWGAAWVHAMAAIPWVYWLVRLGLESIPPHYEEAASLDGHVWMVIYRVTLPLVWPVVLGSGMFVAIQAMTEITVTDRYQYRSYAEVIYSEFALTTSFDDLPIALAPVAFNLIALVLMGVTACQLAGARVVHATAASQRVALVPKSRWATGFVAFVVILLFGVPLVNLGYQAGIEVRQLTDGRVRTWSLSKFAYLLGSSPYTYRYELAWSAVLAQLSVASSLLLGIAWAWWSYGCRMKQLAGMFVCVVCFATPGTLVSFAIISMLNRPHWLCMWMYDDTVLAPWLAMTVKCLPFSCLVLWYGLRLIPQSIIDAANMDGASHWSTLWYVVIPNWRASIFCAALVCIAVSMGDLSASLLVLPPDVTTVSSRIFSLIHYGAEDQLAALTLCCTGMMVVLAIAARSAFQHRSPANMG